jgi:hypothetical protein
MVEFELRHYVRASQLLEQSLASRTKPLSAEQQRAVEELLTRTRQFVVRYTLALTPAAASAQISVDGAASELDPHGRIALVAGEHNLRVTAAGYQPLDLKLDGKGAEERTVRVNLTPLTSSATTPPAQAAALVTRPYRKLGIALTAAGGVLIGASAAAWISGWSKAKNSPTSDGDDADTARMLGLAGDIGIGIGIASAVTGVVLLLQRRREQPPARSPHIESFAPQLRVRF